MKKEPNFRNSMKISSLLLATAFTAFAVPANATGLGTDRCRRYSGNRS